MRGEATSHPVRILELSGHGFWVDLGDERLYAGFADFPWFAGATAEQIGEVRRPSVGHLYWPALDVDLSVASLRDPAAFPMVARG
ncbi:hypothetical protein FHW83_001368 [Duganella sp. SG902]|uniref:DUF2442 domain-containing protein n=1 Tax=Duganella sp. SG902 TaxID=2587016 RepID=UPI00159D6D30|nr:DUF2442 domain-containing protein [Duganella sp. SG902]NVM75581.1 hypothetical protein [Duganella sp. SG902]